MLRQGPIPRFVHSVIEYLGGVFFVVAPFILDYEGGPTAVSIVAGVLLIFLAAVSEAPLGLIPQVPAGAHVVFDYAVSILMIAAPFIFAFSDQGAPTAVFIAGGVVYLLVAVATRYLHEGETLREQRKLRRSRRKGKGEPLTEAPEYEPPQREGR
jgi:hypothetical protein